MGAASACVSCTAASGMLSHQQDVVLCMLHLQPPCLRCYDT